MVDLPPPAAPLLGKQLKHGLIQLFEVAFEMFFSLSLCIGIVVVFVRTGNIIEWILVLKMIFIRRSSAKFNPKRLDWYCEV